MFEQAVLLSSASGRRAWATGLGLTVESLFVATAVLIPMLWPQALPRPQLLIALLEPTAPYIAVHHPPAADRAQILPRVTKHFNQATLVVPSHVPPHLVDIKDPADYLGAVAIEGFGVGQGDGRGLGLITGILESAHATPLPRTEAAAPVLRPAPSIPPRIKQGGMVQEARLIRRVEPVYPRLAREMRIEGTVELTSVIGVDGRFKELRVVTGHPLLAAAALQAVSQWIYRPTYLDGEPVEVIAPIMVTFRLNR